MKTNTTFRQKNGSWQIIVSYKDGNTWKQKSKQGFATKREAKEHERELIKQIKKPRPIQQDMAGITLTDFCETYIKTKQLLHSTAQNYRNAVKSLQSVSNKPIHIITYLDIQNAVSGAYMKPQTIKQYCSKLKVLFRAAIKPYRLITENPMDDIEIPKVRKKERITISEADFNKLLATAHPQVRIALAISYYAGLRKAELFALTWDDVKDMTITIDKQLNWTHTGRTEIVPLKTQNGYRTIPIPTVLNKMLAEYRQSQPISIDKRIIYRKSYVYKQMCQALKTVDEALTPHCLRHTYATNLLAKGMDIRTVSALLGDHVKTVLNTYVHYSDDMRSAAAKEIEKIFAQNF